MRSANPINISVNTNKIGNEMETQLAAIIFCDTEGFEALGRVVNALEAVKEFKTARRPVKLLFDGAGTKWVPKLSDPSHQLAGLFREVRDKVAGACAFCAGAFQVGSAITSAEISLLGEFDNHPSYLNLSREGYQIVTF